MLGCRGSHNLSRMVSSCRRTCQLLEVAWGLAMVALPGRSSVLQTDVDGCLVAPSMDDTRAFELAPAPTHDALAAQVPGTARIGAIRYRRFTVFNADDPRDDNALFRLANRIHVVTRPGVVAQQILVREGDPWSLSRLQESERILRRREFIFDAALRPVRLCGDIVDIEVVTRDTWTLSASARFRRAGGNNRFEFGIEEENLLGTGKGIAFNRFSDGDRTGTGFFYTDPAILGSRWEMFALLSDNSDGYRHDLRVERPFYAVHTPWSATAEVLLLDQEDRNWFRGSETEEFQRRRDRIVLRTGIGTALGGQRVRRWLLGAVFDDSRFDFSDSLLRPEVLPDDRRYTYAFAGMESTEDRFVETTNLNFIARPEDVFVGAAWRASLGWSAAAFGADRNHLVVDADYGTTLWYDPRRLWQVGARAEGFVTTGGRAENLRWQLETRYFQRQTERTATAMQVRGTWVAGQTRDQQLLLGGETGLRGYERNFQVGDRSVLLNMEQRYYARWHPLRLARVAYVAFADVGRAWYGNRPDGRGGGVLGNVGVGLRTMSSRTDGRAVFHLDFAVPLVRGEAIDKYQVLVTVRQSL
jgi:hypothetical protein